MAPRDVRDCRPARLISPRERLNDIKCHYLPANDKSRFRPSKMSYLCIQKMRSQAALGNIKQAYIALACTDIAS